MPTSSRPWQFLAHFNLNRNFTYSVIIIIMNSFWGEVRTTQIPLFLNKSLNLGVELWICCQVRNEWLEKGFQRFKLCAQIICTSIKLITTNGQTLDDQEEGSMWQWHFPVHLHTSWEGSILNWILITFNSSIKYPAYMAHLQGIRPSPLIQLIYMCFMTTK